jgi:DNA-binding NarL/FixJ family response regulator
LKFCCNGLRALLASVPETVVVGGAANGEEAIAQAAELQPDIILMDLHMPGLNGVEATRSILQVSPHIGVLVLTMLEDDASVFAAMRAGARGYLLKGADQAEILSAITAHEILGLIAIGKSNAEIAEELVLSPKTVSNHVSNIFSKLRVVDRAQAVLRAKQAGLG